MYKNVLKTTTPVMAATNRCEKCRRSNNQLMVICFLAIKSKTATAVIHRIKASVTGGIKGKMARATIKFPLHSKQAKMASKIPFDC